MSVTTSSYTTNSTQITVNNETSSTNVISAVNVALISLGWSLYDTVATTAFNPITTYVYRALCADGTTYKYFIIRWDTVKLFFYTSTCQSWDSSVTHLPTNESWASAGGFAQGYDILTSTILVSATSRHVMIWSYVNAQPGIWSGVFEFERIASEDTQGLPCFAWTNSLMVGTPWGQPANTTASNIMFSFPQTPDGITGAAAASIYAPVTNRGMFPPSFPSANLVPGTVAAISTADPNLLHLGSYYNVNYGWNTLATVVSPVSIDAMSKSMPFGRGYNLGVTKPIGAGLDTTTLLGDATGGWPSGSGTSTNYLILGMSGGYEGSTAYAAGQCSLTTGTAGTVILSKPIQIGTTVWLAASDGIRTYDINIGQGGTTTLRVPNSNGIHDIVYDGQQTVYGSTSNGIVNININTFTTASITTITTGTSYLGIDNKYVYAASRTALNAPQVYSINRANFTVTATYTLATTTLTNASGFGTPIPSYTGTVYVATQAGSTTLVNNMRIASFFSDTGVQFTNASNPRSSLSMVQADCPTSFFIDPASSRLFCAVSTATNGTIYELSVPALTTASAVATLGTVVGGSGYTNGTYNGVALSLSSGPAPYVYPTANITVSGGAVTAVTLVTGGLGVNITTVFTAPTATIGNGTSFTVPVATLVASPTFTTGATGAVCQSNMALTTTIDGRGDLNIVPWRGTHIITTKRPGIASASYTTRVSFMHPTATTTGTAKLIYSSASSLGTFPGGYSSNMTSNGVYLVGTSYIAAANNYVNIVNGLYNLTNIAGGQSGRLLVKA